MGTVVRRRHLWSSRGFLCSCARCSHPRDEVRQVVCRECSGRSDSGPPAAQINGYDAPEKGGNGEAFADWWNQSGMWVCRSCGWCSRVDGDTAPTTDSLHPEESVLSADTLRLIIADVAHGQSAPSSGSEAAREDSGGTLQQDSSRELQAKRDVIKTMLERSVTLLGRRHWVTFSCAHARLKQELSCAILSRSGGSRWSPPSASSQSFHDTSPPPPTLLLPPPLPLPSLAFFDWAMRELTGLWQWLSAALEPATSHPPSYYLFDVVCDLLDAMRGCPGSGAGGKLQPMVGRVVEWVSVFGDEEQRRRFAAAVKTTV